MSALPPLAGIHHVTAICSDPRRNHDFYTGLLGLRLVKRTVNFDDPTSWHLYYGDRRGSPGTALTFFSWAAAPLTVARGRVGAPQVCAVPFAVPPGSLGWWVDRLAERAVDFRGPEELRGDSRILFEDPDGLSLEMVEREASTPETVWWEEGGVPEAHAIRGFAGAPLLVEEAPPTRHLLKEVMGMEEERREGARTRLRPEGAPETVVDVVEAPPGPPGRTGTGTVHHVAWRVPDDEAQVGWRERLVEAGMPVTPVVDRHWFHSIYFREPGGVLFEIATDGPGFTRDEDEDELGSRLALPPWMEERRERIEARLPEVGG